MSSTSYASNSTSYQAMYLVTVKLCELSSAYSVARLPAGGDLVTHITIFVSVVPVCSSSLLSMADGNFFSFNHCCQSPFFLVHNIKLKVSLRSNRLIILCSLS